MLDAIKSSLNTNSLFGTKSRNTLPQNGNSTTKAIVESLKKNIDPFFTSSPAMFDKLINDLQKIEKLHEFAEIAETISKIEYELKFEEVQNNEALKANLENTLDGLMTERGEILDKLHQNNEASFLANFGGGSSDYPIQICANVVNENKVPFPVLSPKTVQNLISKYNEANPNNAVTDDMAKLILQNCYYESKGWEAIQCLKPGSEEMQNAKDFLYYIMKASDRHVNLDENKGRNPHVKCSDIHSQADKRITSR
jgi:hypothetical protein